jgi:hypothetical protein
VDGFARRLAAAVTSEERRPSSERWGSAALWFCGFAFVAYVGITALCGFQVGRQIEAAKRNPLIGLGSAMIGRDATERFAVRESHLPRIITASPIFWMALRATE